MGGSFLCKNRCGHSFTDDGVCDDGGPGEPYEITRPGISTVARYAISMLFAGSRKLVCDYGHDCGDCGVRWSLDLCVPPTEVDAVVVA